MTFLAPWFLIGILAAAIPLMLHLRRSRRADRLVFSTTQFFDERFLRSARRARLQDLLLMMLRMALLALLALALAQPLVRTSPLAGLLGMDGAPREVAIVLDDSASMTADSPRGMLLTRAKQGALDVIDSLSPARGDRATVILGGARETGPTPLFDEPTPALDEVRRAVEQITPTDLATDLDSAIGRANDILGGGEAGSTRARREIYVFSDGQSSGLRQRDTFDLDPTTGLLLVSTRPETNGAGNLSIDALQYGAARPMSGVPFTFRALVTNHGDTPRTTTAEFVINGNVTHQKPVTVPAGRSTIMRFTHQFTEPGWHGGHVRLAPGEAGADLMPADDARHFAVRVAEQVRVLAVNGAASEVAARDELFFFRLALTVHPTTRNAPSISPPTPTPIELEQIQPDALSESHLSDRERIVVLANVSALPRDTVAALERFVDRGGQLLIALGDRVLAEQYNQWLGPNRLHGGLLPARLVRLVGRAERADAEGVDASDLTPADEAGGVAEFDAHHPALAGFESGELGGFSNVRFERRYQLDARDADVLMQGPTGAPLLVEKRFGRGRVMLFASTIDRDWTNFPLQPTYIPWLYRLVGYLAQPTVSGANFVRTGQIVALPGAATEVESLHIEQPDGTIAYPAPDPHRTDETQSALTRTGQAGVYTVREPTHEAATPRLMFAANAPPEESQLTYLDQEAFVQQAGQDAPIAFIDAPEQVITAGTTARQGYGLWNALLWIALLVALVEPWIANQLSQRRATRSRDAMDKRDVIPASVPRHEPEPTMSS